MNVSILKRSCLLFLLSLAVQTASYTLVARHNPSEIIQPDSREYLACKDTYLAAGNFDSLECLKRPPGYPFCLALLDVTTDRVYPGILFNQLLVASVCVLFFLLMTRFFSLGFSWIWGALFSVDLTLLRHSNHILTESLSLFLLSLCLFFLYLSLKTRGIVLFQALGGIVQGVSVFVKPAVLLWPLIQAAFTAVFFMVSKNNRRFDKKAAAGMVLYLLFSLGIPFLWSQHNLKVHGYRAISSTGLEKLFVNATKVLQKEYKVSEDAAGGKLRDLMSADAPSSQITWPQRDKLYRQTYAKVVLDHPLAFLKAELESFKKILFSGPAPKFVSKDHRYFYIYQIVSGIYTLWNAFLMLAGVYFIYLMGRKHLRAGGALQFASAALGILMIVYFLTISSPFGTARYRVPILPAIYLLAALGAHARLFTAKQTGR